MKKHGCVGGYSSGDILSKEDFFSTKCDFVIPAALELQITDTVASSLQCTAIFEAANGPTTIAADAILESKNIDVVPDVLCNSGGVVVSYFEWLQNLRYETWPLSRIEEELDAKMKTTFREVTDYASGHKCSLRKASFHIAFNNISCYNVL